MKLARSGLQSHIDFLRMVKLRKICASRGVLFERCCMTLQRSRATTADVASLLVRALFALFLAIAIAASEARAGTVLGVDVQNYIIMYEGGGANQLSINNFGTTQIWSGDIGIAGTGKLAASGPGTV